MIVNAGGRYARPRYCDVIKTFYDNKLKNKSRSNSVFVVIILSY